MPPIPSHPHDEQSGKQKARSAPRKEESKADDALREQTRTEVEERPYLDTEGGE